MLTLFSILVRFTLYWVKSFTKCSTKTRKSMYWHYAGLNLAISPLHSFHKFSFYKGVVWSCMYAAIIYFYAFYLFICLCLCCISVYLYTLLVWGLLFSIPSFQHSNTFIISHKCTCLHLERANSQQKSHNGCIIF